MQQQTILSSHFNPFPQLHMNDFDIVNGSMNTLLTDHHNNQTMSFEQIGSFDCGSMGDYGILEPYMMEMEWDLSIPGLESSGNNNEGVENVNDAPNDYVVGKKEYNCVNNTIMINNNNTNNHFNDVEESLKVEDMVYYENHWQGQTFKSVEYLDFEGMFANVSPLPNLDFQIEYEKKKNE
ncbi:hypothetical protein LIER_18841 [Lithospermum erythrorhizon]|uniref:Uncharacterized protein n=1 Tax=Lithospermum erythrorhizon TaxID=34254 RepID=A0AAV3QJJ0_LITER